MWWRGDLRANEADCRSRSPSPLRPCFADPEQLPAYNAPLGEGKGGPPAYAMGQDQAAVELSQEELPSDDARAGPAGPAAEGPQAEGPQADRGSVVPRARARSPRLSNSPRLSH